MEGVGGGDGAAQSEVNTPVKLLFSPFFLPAGSFTLAELGVCESNPSPHPATAPYCPDLGLLQRGYSLSAGSDADSDPEGALSPEQAIQLWAGCGGVKSRRSSGVSSHENSVLTLTDSDNDNKSDDESGRTNTLILGVGSSGTALAGSYHGNRVRNRWRRRLWRKLFFYILFSGPSVMSR